MILPQMEGNNVYNAMNLLLSPSDVAMAAQFTAWNTVFTSWLCPSDGNNGGGRVPNGYSSRPTSSTPIGAQPHRPINGYNLRHDPVSNYAGSFGDNYCGGVLAGPGLPWETPGMAAPPLGQPRIGWNGYWGTSFGPPDGFTLGRGTMRGYLRLPRHPETTQHRQHHRRHQQYDHGRRGAAQ